ncbi:MAG: CoA transferase subunit A [Halobacteriales archaeon]
MESLEEAVAPIEDGATVFVGGFIINANPWALALELVRQEKRDLTAVGYGMMSIDVLVGAGCVDTLWGSVNTFEPKFGRPPSIRRRIEAGDLDNIRESGNATVTRLTAGAYGIPSMATRALLGSDMLADLEARGLAERTTDPFSGEDVVLLEAVQPDYALIHAPRSDPQGNVQFFGPGAFTDEAVLAADAVIASVDEVVSQEEIRRTPEDTMVPSHKVQALVEAPFGAFPTSVYRYYDHDEPHIGEYADRAATEEGFQSYLEEYVLGMDHVDFLDRIGLERLMDRRADPYFGY